MLMPKKTTFRKSQRGRMKGNETRGTVVSFGSFGLKCLSTAWITNRQIEAARIAMTRFMKRDGKVWIKVFPDKSVTKKPAETRMGSGKGVPEFWVAPVKPELRREIAKVKRRIAALSFNKGVEPLQNPMIFTEMRKDVARMLTRLNQTKNETYNG
ncbi:hypothetical protein CHS0354_023760 [Potamilus streckersoni]|uniref:Large ribosomal subunit protein uL16m n=1 Tax=Potamilus streckersoni TaxID=2493646 RepID=A0AAE0RZ17_9BIVA|nr:hypothetical protein CHS0354_023760 [Potamilus streckersoni]